MISCWAITYLSWTVELFKVEVAAYLDGWGDVWYLFRVTCNTSTQVLSNTQPHCRFIDSDRILWVVREKMNVCKSGWTHLKVMMSDGRRGPLTTAAFFQMSPVVLLQVNSAVTRAGLSRNTLIHPECQQVYFKTFSFRFFSSFRGLAVSQCPRKTQSLHSVGVVFHSFLDSVIKVPSHILFKFLKLFGESCQGP